MSSQNPDISHSYLPRRQVSKCHDKLAKLKQIAKVLSVVDDITSREYFVNSRKLLSGSIRQKYHCEAQSKAVKFLQET